MTKLEKYAEALAKMGFNEIKSGSRKYRTFCSPGGTLYFLGKSGAVRTGKCASGSYAVSESFKAAILRLEV